MSTVRSIERRLYIRRQADRDLASSAPLAGGEIARHMEWNGIWTGYMTFVGVGVLLLSFVLAVGFSSLDPLRASSWASVGTGTLVWSIIVLLIATYLGCWVAARTPRTTKKHGMMKAITLWGMILLSVLFLVGWVGGTAASAAGGIAGSAASALNTNRVQSVQGVLQSNGINITNAQATNVSNQLMAGDHTGAATTLANAAGISTARADTVLGQVATPVAGAATTAGEAVKHGAGSLAWGIFWISLIGLGVALLGGSTGGGGINLRRIRPNPQPAA